MKALLVLPRFELIAHTWVRGRILTGLRVFRLYDLEGGPAWCIYFGAFRWGFASIVRFG